MGKILSIIVPTYNMEQYLDCCLSSVDIDYEDNYEVLIINDGSRDGSRQIALRYQDRRPDVFRLIDKKNGNYGSCVNRGLKEASGKYVKILDADDAFSRDSFREYLDYLYLSDVDLVLSDGMTMDNDNSVVFGSSTNFGFPKDMFKLSDISETDIRRIEHFYITYKRSLFEDLYYHQTEGISYTDLEWDFYPMMLVSSVSFFQKPVYLYRMWRPGNTVSPETHCRNLWMERTVISRIIGNMATVRATAVPDNLHFLTTLLRRRAESIYFFHCVKYPKLLQEKELIEFDCLIKQSCQELYHALSESSVTLFKQIDFKYVSLFRKKNTRKSLPFIFLDFYYIVICLCRQRIIGK